MGLKESSASGAWACENIIKVPFINVHEYLILLLGRAGKMTGHWADWLGARKCVNRVNFLVWLMNSLQLKASFQARRKGPHRETENTRGAEGVS